MVSSIQFQLTSELNATTPTFTLTCISTGGPATNVSWTVNNSAVTEDSAHNITSQVLTDAETATYTHTLVVTGRLVGQYECTVSNNKPSSASRMLAVVGKTHLKILGDVGEILNSYASHPPMHHSSFFCVIPTNLEYLHATTLVFIHVICSYLVVLSLLPI